jgi:hypothetical protein
MKTKLQILISQIELEIKKVRSMIIETSDDHIRGHVHGLNRALYFAKQINYKRHD